MGLVDGEQRQAGAGGDALQERHESRGQETFGRNVQQLERADRETALDRRCFVVGQG
jgi:hypothetical protein